MAAPLKRRHHHQGNGLRNHLPLPSPRLATSTSTAILITTSTTSQRTSLTSARLPWCRRNRPWQRLRFPPSLHRIRLERICILGAFGYTFYIIFIHCYLYSGYFCRYVLLAETSGAWGFGCFDIWRTGCSGD